NLACIVWMCRWAWRLAGGGRLQGAPASASEHAAAILGTLCALTYIHNCLAHQQTDLLIGALLLGGCLLFSRAHTLAAASCWGVAAAMKCTPLLFAPYLLWRRRPAAAVWLVIVAAGVNLLPELVHRGPDGHTWVSVFAARYLRPLTAANHNVGT